jgi:hypothetical protein
LLPPTNNTKQQVIGDETVNPDTYEKMEELFQDLQSDSRVTLMPVAVMTFIQFKPKVSPLIKAVVFAALAAFVMEPLGVWLRFYRPVVWRHIYSFRFSYSSIWRQIG